MNLGKSLRLAMEHHDVDAETLAKGLNRSVSMINTWRRAESGTTATIQLLADFFHMEPSAFIALSEKVK